MKTIKNILLIIIAITLSACTKNGYVNTIPSESIALGYIDVNKMNGNNILKDFIDEDIENCGIDFSEKIYIFETSDGTFGMCAKVDNADNLTNFFDNNLAKKNKSSKTKESKGNKFTLIKNSWIAGYSNDAILIMGPTLVASQAQLQLQINKYLKAEEDNSIIEKPIFQKLDSLNAPFSIVAQMQALPTILADIFSIGTPKSVDISQTYIAAEITPNEKFTQISGETFSFNTEYNKYIQEAKNAYKPIGDAFLSNIENNNMVNVFFNVDGNTFLQHLRANKTMQAMLAGANTALDLDNIIRSINGNIGVFSNDITNFKQSFYIIAQMKNISWINDINYWKTSLPSGNSMSVVGKQQFRIETKTNNGKVLPLFYFGLSNANTFFAGTMNDVQTKVSNSVKIDKDMKDVINNSKMCVVINISDVANNKMINDSQIIKDILKPFLGKSNRIVCAWK